jgi:hypothetical protein
MIAAIDEMNRLSSDSYRDRPSSHSEQLGDLDDLNKSVLMAVDTAVRLTVQKPRKIISSCHSAA